MAYTFNLIDQPWISCQYLDDKTQILSLRGALVNAHTLRGIQGDSPLETAVLYRILIALLHSIFRGPRNHSEWAKLWKMGCWQPQMIDPYLEKWYDRFDIFHPEKPFFQVKQEAMALKNAGYLTHGMATANELFEHSVATGEAVLTSDKAARQLLVGQAYGLGGLCHPQLKISLTTSPLTRGIIFLVEGSTLFETLILNMLRYSQDEPIPTNGTDRPVWEMDDPFNPRRELPLGYLDYLTWQNRKILLIPEYEMGQIVVRKFYLARGLDLAEVQDPWKQYKKTDKGWRHWAFTEDRSLWRDSHTLFQFKHPGDTLPPKTIEWLALLVQETDCLNYNQTYRYLALGTGMHYKDAKIFFYRQEYMPLPMIYLHEERSDELIGDLSQALDISAKVQGKLWGAVNILSKFLLAPNNDASNGRQADPKDVKNLNAYWAVERDYWGELELPFINFIEDLPQQGEQAINKWKHNVIKTAWSALAKAINLAGETPNALKASVKARTFLGASLKTLFEPQ